MLLLSCEHGSREPNSAATAGSRRSYCDNRQKNMQARLGVKGMNCLKTKDFGNVKAKNRYATSEDFCRVYRDNLDSLYRLSFLLTGDQRKAEQCFLAGLEESIRAERVFKDWAQRWVKVTIIRYTIAALQPRPEDIGSSFDDTIPAEESEL
jgi:hypothetical protein